MEIVKIYAEQKYRFMDSYCACIGYFDGLHLGHQKLIQKVKEIALERNVKSACICFDEDPWVVLNKTADNTHLTPFKQRLSLLEGVGIETCFVLHFDTKMASMNPTCFVSLLESLNLSCLVCGNDFSFGSLGKGNIEDLKKRKFDLVVEKDECFEGYKISSSIIERQIQNGEIQKANYQLGYIYALKGRVIKGSQVGKRILGFATANLSCDENYVIPKRGVYYGYVDVRKKRYAAMINIGHNPTMNHKDNISIEAHIVDFDEMIYGEPIVMGFIEYLREEKKFSSIENLIVQLSEDIEIVKCKAKKEVVK